MEHTFFFVQIWAFLNHINTGDVVKCVYILKTLDVHCIVQISPVQDQQNYGWTSKFLFRKMYKKFKNFIRSSKFKFSLQGLAQHFILIAPKTVHTCRNEGQSVWGSKINIQSMSWESKCNKNKASTPIDLAWYRCRWWFHSSTDCQWCTLLSPLTDALYLL